MFNIDLNESLQSSTKEIIIMGDCNINIHTDAYTDDMLNVLLGIVDHIHYTHIYE